MKNITAKAEELVEEKKNAATALLEKQVCIYNKINLWSIIIY